MSVSKKILVTGAGSGLGYAVAQNLLKSEHSLFVVARNTDSLEKLKQAYPKQLEIIPGDLREPAFIKELAAKMPRDLGGAFINAGGPPAATLEETSMAQWDEAYRQLIRWKVQLSQLLLPGFKRNKYGRLLYSESTSITRPVDNLGLSNSLRMAIIGYVKTLVLENSNSGITFNIIAPGYHETKAVERLYRKLSEQQNISLGQAQKLLTAKIPTGSIGNANDYASLAAWILSEQAAFLNGQVINLDGGTSV